MNRRKIILSLALAALGASACFSGTTRAIAESAPVAIRVLDPLHVSATLTYDSQLKVTFISVIDDSRCPINAKTKCTSPGDAEVVLRIKVGTKKAKTYYLHTKTFPKQLEIPADPTKTGTTGIPKSYVIDIATLNPQPYAGKTTKQSDYQLRLHLAEVL
ncbi:MAG: hypothetical protein ABIS50_26575 [Luteolibacter sp.]|uniref:hypothetical protein n=1 Tax=Luteolibacter sp. TaxID=1962973 RepID=UPI003266B0C5